MKKLKIAVLGGDGIGQEVTESVLPLFSALNLPIDLTRGDIGWKYWCEEGNPVPQRTWDLIESSDATLLGAITSLPEKEAEAGLCPSLRGTGLKYLSPIIQLRQKLDLHANIRPIFTIKDRLNPFNFVVIRENTEGLYAGLDFYPLPESLQPVFQTHPKWAKVPPESLSASIRVQSAKGLERIFKFAFAYAKKEGFNRVTFADKPNVLRSSAAFARKIFEAIAADYPDIKTDILNVDAVALWLVQRPEEFGVIVGENMFTDILSDVGAAVMGGLGFAPSQNIGDSGVYFEPVHGSAPRISPHKANPSAMFLTTSLLLKHLGFQAQSERVIQAVKAVVKSGRYLTYDLGGKASTQTMAQAIIEACFETKIRKSIGFLATGSELLNGQVLESNSHHASGLLTDRGAVVGAKYSVSDQKREIREGLKVLSSHHDAIITIGGLGPTSDDNTRFALAEALGLPLVLNEESFTHVQERLHRFGLTVSEHNQKQALFPAHARILKNEHGSANGCHIHHQGKDFFMLPGPPREFKPLFENYVLPCLEREGYLGNFSIHSFLTLGLLEGEIAALVDNVAIQHGFETAYRWTYPYVEIKLIFEKENPAAVEAVRVLVEKNLVSTSNQPSEAGLKALLEDLPHPIRVQLKSSEPHDFSYLVGLSEKIQPQESEAEFTLELTWPKPEEKSLLKLSVKGSREGKVYEHHLTTFKRDIDMSTFIRAYFCWQLGNFVRRLP
jgi:molybdenum cofactor synthesis domain-containing protein